MHGVRDRTVVHDGEKGGMERDWRRGARGGKAQ
jgi:hypothetical protein